MKASNARDTPSVCVAGICESTSTVTMYRQAYPSYAWLISKHNRVFKRSVYPPYCFNSSLRSIVCDDAILLFIDSRLSLFSHWISAEEFNCIAFLKFYSLYDIGVIGSIIVLRCIKTVQLQLRTMLCEFISWWVVYNYCVVFVINTCRI